MEAVRRLGAFERLSDECSWVVLSVFTVLTSLNFITSIMINRFDSSVQVDYVLPVWSMMFLTVFVWTGRVRYGVHDRFSTNNCNSERERQSLPLRAGVL